MFNKSTKNNKADAKSTAYKKIFIMAVWVVIFLLVIALGFNTYVCASAKSNMYESTDFMGEKADCIMVLGCGVRGNEPSSMLKDRLDTAIELYKSGIDPTKEFP